MVAINALEGTGRFRFAFISAQFPFIIITPGVRGDDDPGDAARRAILYKEYFPILFLVEGRNNLSASSANTIINAGFPFHNQTHTPTNFLLLIKGSGIHCLI
jgi:hypothetical protein